MKSCWVKKVGKNWKLVDELYKLIKCNFNGWCVNVNYIDEIMCVDLVEM